MSGKRIRVLFFAEGATLAHVARPFLLASELDPRRFEVILARPDAFAWLTKGAPLLIVPLRSQNSATFAQRLEKGKPLYDYETLKDYVTEDSTLIASLDPDIIVGDFRLSLSVSARLRNKPYITICDAYWSPERPLAAPLPVLGVTRWLPLPLVRPVFHLVSPLAFHIHTRPLERLRAAHGLPSLGHDLRKCYTDADLRLFANFKALFPDVRCSRQAAFLGPVAWSPADDRSLDCAFENERIIYVTMGSSGDPAALPHLLPILEETNLPVVVASAGRLPSITGRYGARTRIFDFLPGEQMCRQARLVVCNGGSPTTNQALREGVPVLGICQNMDQFLNMAAVQRYGAGLSVRADRLDPKQLRSMVSRLLSAQEFTQKAQELKSSAALERPLATHLIEVAQPQALQR